MFYICLHGATKWGSLTLLGNWSVTFELAVEELELGSPRRVEIYRLGNGSKRLAESWRRENSFTAGATMPKSKNDKSSDKLLIAGPGGATHQAASSAQGSLTTNQGVVVADNQNTLKSGQRGPSLLEDFHFREKITHFDHERIPERIVHARGSGAHGIFEVTHPIPHLTKASFLAKKGKKTEVFARFSTVAGGAGAGDMPRDVRGFAVKFYTDEGNFDFVGNNIPVFFIQDAIKFPDLIHSVKMEPDRGYPQDAT